MNRTNAAGLAALALTLCLLAGCSTRSELLKPLIPGSSDSGRTEHARPFTVTLRHTQVKDQDRLRLQILEEVADRMESNVPGLKVELEGIEDKVNRFEKLPGEMAAGNPPEIFDLFGGSDTRKYVKAGRLLDLTPILEELGLEGAFNSLDEFTVNGHVYGLPIASFVEGVFYNKRIFRELGVSVPQTWEQLLDVAAKAKASGITPFALASSDAWVINMMLNTLWVRTAGPESVEGFVEGTRKWTDPDVLDGFRRYELLLNKGYLQADSLRSKYAAQHQKFRAGEAAMLFDGSWANASLLDSMQSRIIDDIGFFNFPAVGGKGDGLINGSHSNGYGFSSGVNDRERRAVTEFIKIMYSEEAQKRQLMESGILPSMKLTNMTGIHPIIGVLLEASKNKTFPAFDSIVQAKVRETLETAMQELLGGKLTAEQVLERVQLVQEEANRETRRQP
ncbi:raffinose/stachyose/melibiose transport system substrate-binding protein [Paenibacillus sp. UNCCL117]|uniref:extracellular solute-binding protein n=1 Tax=unclassified Paenibacillus TaxID=185978 RepID=UPI00087F41C4|nr:MULTISPECIES: extracellular solute-binding protein [unclassified Paenibacillus]SDD71032.1 carbohydrate ABC transporter substrate-binding protein, CUT1 family [Paenibacillus sp. cl123]SFW45456.1 raffinose/stachyose/melibiose transport system substrate-binding protein [Paenibacillus sp. UNCCL117]